MLYLYVVIIIVGAIFMVFYENSKEKEQQEKVDNIDDILDDYMKENNISNENVFYFSENKKFLGENYNIYTTISIDIKQKKIYIFEYNDYDDYRDKKDILFSPRIIKFEDIIECELVEDNATIQKGGIGRAVVGGAIAGGVGAVVGATTRKSKNIVSKLEVHIICNNIASPMEVISVISQETDKNGFDYDYLYETANKIYSTIISIIDSNKKTSKPKEVKENNNIKDKLKELKNMYDEELITKEDYEKTKKELLNKISN
jgi:hypothetical protein